MGRREGCVGWREGEWGGGRVVWELALHDQLLTAKC